MESDKWVSMSNGVKSFKDLVVWQKAMLLTELCYKISDQLPRHEMYALGDQIRRC